MKLVVEIPEEQYITLNAKSQEEVVAVLDYTLLVNAIKNGIPLPKGHRFIDADEILNHAFITEDEEGDIFVQKYYCIEKEVMDNALVLFDTLEVDKE